MVGNVQKFAVWLASSEDPPQEPVTGSRGNRRTFLKRLRTASVGVAAMISANSLLGQQEVTAQSTCYRWNLPSAPSCCYDQRCSGPYNTGVRGKNTYRCIGGTVYECYTFYCYDGCSQGPCYTGCCWSTGWVCGGPQSHLQEGEVTTEPLIRPDMS